MNKRGISTIFIILGILVVAALGVAIATGNISVGDVNAPTNLNSVYKADYGHVCCIAGPDETLDGPIVANQKSSTTCSENVDTAGCTIIVTAKAFLLTLPRWHICNTDGSQCGSWQTSPNRGSMNSGETYQFPLEVNKKVEFATGILTTSSSYTWERRGAVYSLIGEENGKILPGNSGSCMISDSLKHQVLSESPNPIPKGFSNCQNYLLDFVAVASQTYNYNGQQVICQARQVYSIDSQQFKDGSTIKIQGNSLGFVECCPAEANCGTDFKFHTTNERQCTYSTECANGGDLYGVTQTTAKYFTCESGQCVPHTKDVECTSDAVCQQRHGEGYVCDLSPGNYGTCKQSVGTFCGDGYCDVGESKSTCPSDCALECKAGEKAVTIKSKVNCAIGWPIYLGCDEKVEQSCQAPGINWLKVLLVALVIISLIIAIKFAKPVWKMLKGLPLIAKIILFGLIILWIALPFTIP